MVAKQANKVARAQVSLASCEDLSPFICQVIYGCIISNKYLLAIRAISIHFAQTYRQISPHIPRNVVFGVGGVLGWGSLSSHTRMHTHACTHLTYVASSLIPNFPGSLGTRWQQQTPSMPERFVFCYLFHKGFAVTQD